MTVEITFRLVKKVNDLSHAQQAIDPVEGKAKQLGWTVTWTVLDVPE